MPAEKLSMKKVREVIRLYSQGLSYRAISKSTGIGLGSVSEYIKRAKVAKLSWPLPVTARNHKPLGPQTEL